MGTSNGLSFYLWPMSHVIFLNIGAQTKMIIFLKLLQKFIMNAALLRSTLMLQRPECTENVYYIISYKTKSQQNC